MIKLNRINALVLACGLTLSASAFFAGKANAQTATGTATFTGTVAPSCTVSAGAFGTNIPYTNVGTGPSGGTVSLTAISAAGLSFDCNSDTVNITATVATTQPTIVNAVNLAGVHVATLTSTTPALNLTLATGVNTFTATATDADGDINSLRVTSTWTDVAAGDTELFNGTYTASVIVSVTAP